MPEGQPVLVWLDESAVEIAHLRPEDREFFDQLAARRAEVFRRLAERGEDELSRL